MKVLHFAGKFLQVRSTRASRSSETPFAAAVKYASPGMAATVPSDNDSEICDYNLAEARHRLRKTDSEINGALISRRPL